MQNLEELFRQTFEDEVLTRSERRALAKILTEESLNEQELGVLRSRIFKIVEEEMDDMRDQRLLEWLRSANKLLLPNRNDGSQLPKDRVLFSPGNDCLDAIRQFLDAARKQVDICVFTISDDRITDRIEACHRRGVRVRILTDNDKKYDRGSDIHELVRAGLTVREDRTDDHMHHKFALIDQTVALTGSYNWTRSAANHNHENLLITHEPSVVTAYQREFDQLWPKMAEL
ncbi:phospholipase D-like domain-containing protein [Pontibacter sp. G13]|uniref:phospholipase D-like domain-containing protein n=1 Tax=Pontibacter sp. G13 TaxID=3074898 RepID=UPI00288A5A39|nr:phospholipase D-like domain-containing protein [Pontibacter sp. G13]WNJ20766.1 phospholipase D-like domain-containing protein [Pontibacter sp. G13]